MKRVFIGSDFHCGHTVGLTPTKFQGSEDGRSKHFNQRKDLWKWFTSELKGEKFDLALLNGDLIDGRGDRSGGTEQLTVDREVQAEMAVSVIRTINAPKNYLTYGTGYHVGKEEDWEKHIASEIKANLLCDHLNIIISGLSISMRHQIAGTGSVPSRFTGLSNAQIKQLLWAERGHQPRANLLIRSHVHVCRYVGEPASNWAAWTTPALQGLGSKYGARAIDGLPVDFGYLVLEVKSEKVWGIEAHIAPIEIQKAKTVIA